MDGFRWKLHDLSGKELRELHPVSVTKQPQLGDRVAGIEIRVMEDGSEATLLDLLPPPN